MKYSRDQNRDIQRYYRSLDEQINLSKNNSKAIQTLIINKQIPVDLLDTRNVSDIETDQFAKQALLNDYSNKLIKNGNPYEFQNKIKGCEEFFINNFPRIEKEAKMYRIQNPLNMSELVKKLFNKNKQENKSFKYERTRDLNIKMLLQEISKNLKELLRVSGNMPNLRQQYSNALDQTHALFHTIQQYPDSQDTIIEETFRQTPEDFKDSLSQMVSATTPPQDPSQGLPTNIDPNGSITNLSPQDLSNAISNILPQTSRSNSVEPDNTPFKSVRGTPIDNTEYKEDPQINTSNLKKSKTKIIYSPPPSQLHFDDSDDINTIHRLASNIDKGIENMTTDEFANYLANLLNIRIEDFSVYDDAIEMFNLFKKKYQIMKETYITEQSRKNIKKNDEKYTEKMKLESDLKKLNETLALVKASMKNIKITSIKREIPKIKRNKKRLQKIYDDMDKVVTTQGKTKNDFDPILREYETYFASYNIPYDGPDINTDSFNDIWNKFDVSYYNQIQLLDEALARLRSHTTTYEQYDP